MQKLLKLMAKNGLDMKQYELRSYKIIQSLPGLIEKKAYINRKVGGCKRILPEMGQGKNVSLLVSLV